METMTKPITRAAKTKKRISAKSILLCNRNINIIIIFNKS
jgi:hypothetical protein